MMLDEKYWENRWQLDQTGWDLKAPAPAIMELVLTNCSKEDKILIPGAGNAYEAATLFEEYGYVNVFICDWAKQPLDSFKKRNPNFPKDQILHINFFDIKQQFDFIIEQTFFCAIPVELRKSYCIKAYELLVQSGHIMGLLFNRKFDMEGPPFGGSKEEYESLFRGLFKIHRLENSQISIKARLGSELIFAFEKC